MTAEATLCPKVLAKVLEEVAQFSVAPNNPDFLRLAAPQVSELLKDEEKTERFLSILEKYFERAESMAGGISSVDDFSNFSPKTASPSARPPPGRAGGGSIADAEQLRGKIGDLISLAIDEIPSRQTDTFKRFLRFLTYHLAPVPHAREDSRTSGVVELELGHRAHSELSYRTEDDQLLASVTIDNATSTAEPVALQDADAARFARDIVEAFHGNAEYAKVALTSLRHTINQH